MNLWHTSHSNIRVMRCICRWRSNMFFVLQTKLQNTHSNPGRTGAGCTGAWGRGTGGQERGWDPPSSSLTPVTPFQALSPASLCKRSDSSGGDVTGPSPPPQTGCRSSQWECSWTRYLFPTPLLMRGHPPRVGGEGSRLHRPTHLLPYLSRAFPHCSVRAGPRA